MEPIEEEPYEVITLKKLTTRANFVDLNDSGQALWREDGQPILWDDGRIWKVSVGSYLGPDGAILGTINERAALWRDGTLTRLPGSAMGFGADGTVYYARSDTVFSWRDGVEEATDLPVGIGLMSPARASSGTIGIRRARSVSSIGPENGSPSSDWMRSAES